MNLAIELERETDGRWIAEIDALNGVLVYGETREDAIQKVKKLALSVIAERLENENQKMYLSESDKQKIIKACHKNDISFCALFGSFARGEATEKSDIDLLVQFSKPKGFNWLDAAFEIEDSLGKKVDLVTENGLSPHIREYVLKDLQVLYGKRK